MNKVGSERFDTISFICEAIPNEYYGSEGSEYLSESHRDLKITVLINGVSIGGPTFIDVYSLILKNLDHKPYWYGETKPCGNWSQFTPWSCSCGEAGCAGIWDGIYIKERGYSIEWRAKREDGYGFLPKTFFNFGKSQYKHAFDDILTQILGLCSDYPNTILVVDPGYCEEQLVTGIDFLEYVRENSK